jgi:hypothetical protein
LGKLQVVSVAANGIFKLFLFYQVSGMEFDNRLASVRDRLVELVQAEMEGLLASHIRSSLIQQKEGFSCPTFSQPAW